MEVGKKRRAKGRFEAGSSQRGDRKGGNGADAADRRGRRCFRCLGVGHITAACREPATCWRCRGVGHRKSGCKFVFSTPKVPRRTTQVTLKSDIKVPRVTVCWSKEVQDRVSNLQRCVLADWAGTEVLACGELVHLLKQRWNNLDFSNTGWLCRDRAIIRLPSINDRDLLLAEGSLMVDGGIVLFSACDILTGASGELGSSRKILLSGVPLAWRTEEAIRTIVEPLGWFQSMFEDASGEEAFPPVRVSVLANSGIRFPDSIEVCFGGWTGVVSVKEEDDSHFRSYVAAVRNNSSDRKISSRGGRKDAVPMNYDRRRKVDTDIGLVSDTGALSAEQLGERPETLCKGRLDGGLSNQPYVMETGDILALPQSGGEEDGTSSVAGQEPSDKMEVQQQDMQNGETPLFKESFQSDREVTFLGVNIGVSPSLVKPPQLANASHSPSLGSTPSIRDALGPGSWANQVGEDGVARWVWFNRTPGGESDHSYSDPARGTGFRRIRISWTYLGEGHFARL
ncbi:hypothetical protein QJS10_CPB14g01403 [Acorus calamus]|uniref:CCHC-type domain-containing protein n=1 Tax=Acorus calamus TaxID=4465 RepID=A0AAV9DCB0_ACOCL|nr:hypothetical protein QJS10_CPB14g01403 [Acorus calamus]